MKGIASGIRRGFMAVAPLALVSSGLVALAAVASSPAVSVAWAVLGLTAGLLTCRAVACLSTWERVLLEEGEPDEGPLTWWERLPFLRDFHGDGGRYTRLPLLSLLMDGWRQTEFHHLWAPSHSQYLDEERRPVRNIMIVLATVALYMLLGNRYGASWLALGIAGLISTFVLVTALDARYRIIPDEVNTLGLVYVLGFAAVTHLAYHYQLLTDARLVEGAGAPPYHYCAFRLDSALLGMFTGAGTLYLFGELGRFLFGREAMGGGDVKLMAYIGAFLGWHGALVTLLASMFLAAAGGGFLLVLGRVRREQGVTRIAFGPYIVAAAALVLYFGPSQMTSKYLVFNEKFVCWCMSLVGA